MLYLLKFQRIKRPNHGAHQRKNLIKIYIFNILQNRLCHGTWLFCLGNMLKNICFFSNFPLAGSMTGDFIGYPLEFQEIKHQPFSMTQPKNKATTCYDRAKTLHTKKASPP